MRSLLKLSSNQRIIYLTRDAVIGCVCVCVCGRDTAEDGWYKSVQVCSHSGCSPVSQSGRSDRRRLPGRRRRWIPVSELQRGHRKNTDNVHGTEKINPGFFSVLFQCCVPLPMLFHPICFCRFFWCFFYLCKKLMDKTEPVVFVFCVLIRDSCCCCGAALHGFYCVVYFYPPFILTQEGYS